MLTYEEWRTRTKEAELAIEVAAEKFPSRDSYCVYINSDSQSDHRDPLLLCFDTEKEMIDLILKYGALFHWSDDENVDQEAAIADLAERKNLNRRSLNRILAGLSRYEFIGLWKQLCSSKKSYVAKVAREGFWEFIDPADDGNDDPIPADKMIEFANYLRSSNADVFNDD